MRTLTANESGYESDEIESGIRFGMKFAKQRHSVIARYLLLSLADAAICSVIPSPAPGGIMLTLLEVCYDSFSSSRIHSD
jgi:hypothetical protein